LPCGDKGICIDESTGIGIVVSGLEVVQTGLLEMAIALGAKIVEFLAIKFNLICWGFFHKKVSNR
jgi:hypothetical protein